MKQYLKKLIALLCVATMLVGCGQSGSNGVAENEHVDNSVSQGSKEFADATVIKLTDEMITVDGSEISNDTDKAVYAANDIVFYLEGQDFTYGEGEEDDSHSQEEADAHTVVHITKPGIYAVSGSLSAGQIAIDLGKDAKDDKDAVVTLILNGVDINCSVAPAVIFYNVYECGSSDADEAVKDVDTTAAGANVVIADGTVNNISGAYVARIYKPESVELNEDGTEVLDAKKLHKYDAAFYSKMSMNVNGDEEGTGVLNINASNEGLDSELHLTINGGTINIVSGNDGINTNEDGASVTTVNGGTLKIRVSGETKEGDGIDSNGWLVINGGTVIAEACGFSADAGIDSDMGIHINGGTVIATGNMLDHISESAQNFAVFQFASSQKGGETYTLKNEAGKEVFRYAPENSFTYVIVSSAELTAGTYSLWMGETQLQAASGGAMRGFGNFGGPMSGNMETPEGMERPKDMENPEEGQRPEGMYRPENGEMPDLQLPEGIERPDEMGRPVEGDVTFGVDNGNQFPDSVPGNMGGMPGNAELSTVIVIVDGGNYFTSVSTVNELK